MIRADIEEQGRMAIFCVNIDHRKEAVYTLVNELIRVTALLEAAIKTAEPLKLALWPKPAGDYSVTMEYVCAHCNTAKPLFDFDTTQDSGRSLNCSNCLKLLRMHTP